MASIFIFISLFCAAGVFAAPGSIIVPCGKSDEACMIRSANIAVPAIAAGIPSLGVEAFDPARVKDISGEVSKFSFKYTDNEVSGYQKCVISDVKLNMDVWNLKFDVKCPTLLLTGHLEASGELLGLPVEGNNDYKLTLGKYLIKVDADIEKINGADGMPHLVIKDFKHKGVPLEPFLLEYNDLKSMKELTPEAKAEFDKKKSLKVLELSTETYIDKLYRNVIIKSVNKFLESVPFDNLFVD